MKMMNNINLSLHVLPKSNNIETYTLVDKAIDFVTIEYKKEKYS